MDVTERKGGVPSRTKPSLSYTSEVAYLHVDRGHQRIARPSLTGGPSAGVGRSRGRPRGAGVIVPDPR